MKKLILTLTIAAFALSTATFADEAKKECPLAAAKKQCAAGDKKSCCSDKKGACADKDKDAKKLSSPKAQ